MSDVEPVREHDEPDALFFDVSGDLFDFFGVVFFLGVDDQEGACFCFEEKKRREEEIEEKGREEREKKER